VHASWIAFDGFVINQRIGAHREIPRDALLLGEAPTEPA
jgi:hypothetical protein